jgi:superfamily II RNA helicase
VLAVGEMFADNRYKNLSEFDILLFVGALAYEPRRMDRFKFFNEIKIDNNVLRVCAGNKILEKTVQRLSLKRLKGIVYNWASGAEFTDIVKMANLADGDYIRLFRQMIDMLKQVKRASHFIDYDLEEKIDKCIDMIDRDIVAVTF